MSEPMAPLFAGPHTEGEFQWTGEFPGPRSEQDLTDRLTIEVARVEESGGGKVQLWLPEVDDAEDEIVARFGFAPYRDLWQLQCPLPSRNTDTPVRPFQPDDADGFLEANNLAFSWHPEQGGMTHEGLAARQAEPWYDNDGFLIAERKGRVAGFNWTKEHRDVDPPVGEIYAIAVHPDFQGLGLGRGLTLAGLAHLHAQGLDVGMLYVESDNVAANRTYEGVGFRYHHTNRAYALSL